MYNSDLPTRAELPSSKQLLRSTILALIVATVLLLTVVLPAEYGIDPTRIGRVLGLTKMGEIKTQLAEEAARDRTADKAQTVTAPKADAPAPPAKAGASEKSDELTVTLKPGEGGGGNQIGNGQRRESSLRMAECRRTRQPRYARRWCGRSDSQFQ